MFHLFDHLWFCFINTIPQNKIKATDSCYIYLYFSTIHRQPEMHRLTELWQKSDFNLNLNKPFSCPTEAGISTLRDVPEI